MKIDRRLLNLSHLPVESEYLFTLHWHILEWFVYQLQTLNICS